MQKEEIQSTTEKTGSMSRIFSREIEYREPPRRKTPRRYMHFARN